LRAEHHAAVGLAGRQEDFHLEHEVGVRLLGDEEKFLVGDEVDLVTDDFGFTPRVRVAPAVEVFAVEERLPRGSGGSGDESGGEEQQSSEVRVRSFMMGDQGVEK